MSVAVLMSAMWAQEPDALSAVNTKLLMIFVGLVALAMLVQAVTVVVMAIGANRTQKKVEAILDEVRNKALPLISSTQEIYTEMMPKVRIITENVTETTYMVRNKVHDFEATLNTVNETVKTTLAQVNETVKAVNATALDVNDRTQAQIAHVDGMVTAVLNKTEAVSASIERGLKAPGRAISNMAAGVKGGIESLLHRKKPQARPMPQGPPMWTSVHPTSPNEANGGAEMGGAVLTGPEDLVK